MKILVTGGSGFIGSSLVNRLLREGYEVTNLDINSGSFDGSFLEGTVPRTIICDVRDSAGVNHAVKGHNIIFHLAARPYIPDGYLDPQGMVEVDMIGTLNMLLAAKKYNVKRFIHISSSEVYGIAQSPLMDETHPTNPLSTYAVAKLAADRLVYTFGHEQNLPFVILRDFNVIGERDTHHRIVPYIVSELVEGHTNIKIGNSGSARDFTYVEDVVDAYIKTIDKDEILGETINIGTGVAYHGFEIAFMAAKILNLPMPTFELDSRQVRPLDVDWLCCDNAKAKRLLGWQPQTGITTALEKIIKWRRDNGPYVWERYYDRYQSQR